MGRGGAQSIVLGIARAFLPYLFPEYCVLCRAEGTIMCDSCIKNIPGDGMFLCPVCDRPQEKGTLCALCSNQSALDAVVSIAAYHDPGVEQLIQAHKYHFQTGVIPVYRELISRFCSLYPELFSNIASLCAVPLHPRRYAERGFNQAEDIARILASVLSVPFETPLHRRLYTKKQAQLSALQRPHNVREAFSLDTTVDLVGKHILIVDDVYTTGATMRECATLLRLGGAHSVIGFSIARQALIPGKRI